MTSLFDKLNLLNESCLELVKALEAARETLSDEVWDEMSAGPFDDILSAAMDVEYYTEKCNES